jgi:hypothetical protein
MDYDALIASLAERLDERLVQANDVFLVRSSLSGHVPAVSAQATPVEALVVQSSKEKLSVQADSALSDDNHVSCQSMSLNLDYKDLAVRLHTQQTMSAEVLKLSAENSLLKEQLSSAQRALDEAHRALGFLEAQVLLQLEQLKNRQQT